MYFETFILTILLQNAKLNIEHWTKQNKTKTKQKQKPNKNNNKTKQQQKNKTKKQNKQTNKQTNKISKILGRSEKGKGISFL